MLCGVIYPTFSQTVDLNKIDQQLTQQYQKVKTFQQQHKYDSLATAKRQFAHKLKYVASHYPATFSYAFKHLNADRNVKIVTSPDSLFRIFSWNQFGGGTMQFEGILYQYKANGQVYADLAYDLHRSGKDPGLAYYKIDTVNVGNKTYYLAFGSGAYSSIIGGQHLKFFQIQNHQLIDTVRLLKIKTGKWINELKYNYNIGLNYPTDRLPNNLDYDKKRDVINFPIVNPERDSVTNQSEIYQFNGTFFEYKTTRKLSWDKTDEN